ncbi:putative activating transcription factor 7-interacting protein 2 [Scophthalmus maximus]|uniref:Putative activating transcription factor 7-interacting protein 2 n=1 Tax=Scophthalmus maximus TaxID=52904 RepID=A0A2U9CW17_SCOMX|nr:putative activating transcription factor 7-interacting protein 2 [Scophthalmus maximus]
MFAPLKLWKFGFYCERARPEVGGTKSRHDAGDHPVSALHISISANVYHYEKIHIGQALNIIDTYRAAFLVQVQTLIEQEVHSAVKTNETKLQCLIETIENLDRGVDFECTIQKLETRINTLTKRTEAALAHMTKTQKKSQHPSPVNVDIIRIDSEDEAVETVSQSKESMDRTGKSGEFLQVMETTKEEMMKMRADNEAWEAAMEDLREISAPPVPTPQGSPECNKNVDKSRMTEEPEAATMRVESPSSGRDNIPKHTGSGQRNVKLLYPPLPSTTVPSVLDSEAASFNIPQGPEVHLALIRDPPGLSVLWKVVEEDPCAPPMDSYRAKAPFRSGTNHQPPKFLQLDLPEF